MNMFAAYNELLPYSTYTDLIDLISVIYIMKDVCSISFTVSNSETSTKLNGNKPT